MCFNVHIDFTVLGVHSKQFPGISQLSLKTRFLKLNFIQYKSKRHHNTFLSLGLTNFIFILFPLLYPLIHLPLFHDTHTQIFWLQHSILLFVYFLISHKLKVKLKYLLYEMFCVSLMLKEGKKCAIFKQWQLNNGCYVCPIIFKQ